MTLQSAYANHRSIDAAPRDGMLIRFWCRSKDDPVIGYWCRAFIGWVSYTEDVPLIRHDVTDWEPIEDQPAARAVPIEKPRRPGDPAIVMREAKAPLRRAAPVRHRVRKSTLVVAADGGGPDRRARTPDARLDLPHRVPGAAAVISGSPGDLAQLWNECATAWRRAVRHPRALGTEGNSGVPAPHPHARVWRMPPGLRILGAMRPATDPCLQDNTTRPKADGAPKGPSSSPPVSLVLGAVVLPSPRRVLRHRPTWTRRPGFKGAPRPGTCQRQQPHE
jgi:hypothetical protein